MQLLFQIILTAVYFLMLGTIIFLLARSVTVGSRRADRAQQALIDVVVRAQENGRLATEALERLTRALSELSLTRLRELVELTVVQGKTLEFPKTAEGRSMEEAVRESIESRQESGDIE